MFKNEITFVRGKKVYSSTDCSFIRKLKFYKENEIENMKIFLSVIILRHLLLEICLTLQWQAIQFNNSKQKTLL